MGVQQPNILIWDRQTIEKTKKKRTHNNFQVNGIQFKNVLSLLKSDVSLEGFYRRHKV